MLTTAAASCSLTDISEFLFHLSGESSSGENLYKYMEEQNQSEVNLLFLYIYYLQCNMLATVSKMASNIGEMFDI
jgi:hypothetical protein